MAFAKMKVISAVYDFSVSGGTIGVIRSGIFLPKGAVLLRAIGQELTAFTAGAGGTMALDAGGTALKAATVYTSGVWGGVDVHLSTPVAITSNSELTFTIAVADFTAGKYALYVEYYNPAA